MEPVLVGGSVIAFEPEATWKWDGWNGELEVQPADNGTTVDGKIPVLESDLMALGKELVGKNYKATGFDNIAGVVIVGNISIKQLSRVASVGNIKVGHKKTEGTFMISCVPAVTTKPPAPVPDPVPVKSGSWHVKAPGQDLLDAS
jgi:hypothetical protein